MFPLYILALLIHAAYSIPCEDGVTIVSKETKNPGDLIGNWTFVYHLDTLYEFEPKSAFNKADRELICPEISIEAVTPDYVKAKEVECKNSVELFNSTAAKVKLNAPRIGMKDAILVLGEKETLLVLSCRLAIAMVMRKVSKDYIMMMNPDVSHITQLYARRLPTKEELKCIVHNVDVLKDMTSRYGLCY